MNQRRCIYVTFDSSFASVRGPFNRRIRSRPFFTGATVPLHFPTNPTTHRHERNDLFWFCRNVRKLRSKKKECCRKIWEEKLRSWFCFHTTLSLSQSLDLSLYPQSYKLILNYKENIISFLYKKDYYYYYLFFLEGGDGRFWSFFMRGRLFRGCFAGGG